VHEDLKKLLLLQDKDRQVMSIQAEMQALEPELAGLDATIAQLETLLAEAGHRVQESAGKREALEGKIESYRVMQERRRQKLEWVRGAKEASTLMAEIDLARSVLAKEEAEWIRSADAVQSAEAAAAEAEARVEQAKEEQAPRRAEIDERLQDCQARLAQARAVRQEETKNINRRLLGQYERILQGRAPLALYPLHEGACGHCFTAVPLHLRHQMKQSEGVAFCEGCGVMVFIETA
jgi:predicted  nucleic acid-binding Zn-ribbon protein